MKDKFMKKWKRFPQNYLKKAKRVAEKKEIKEKKKREVPEKKKKLLEELVKLIEKSNSVIIASLLNIPSSYLQKIRKEIRDKAEIRIIKKNFMFKVLDKAKKEKIKELKDCLDESSAVIFSNMDPFELGVLLSKYALNVKAKAGQISPQDLKIEAGPTELMPGPDISLLSEAGLKTGVEKGKITIKESKVLVKEGERISKSVAEVLSKLEIIPFKVNLEIKAAYDSKEDKIFKGIKINPEEAIGNIKIGQKNALGLAFKILFPIKEVIKQILAKASMNANALKSKIKGLEEKKEEVKGGESS